MPTFENADQAYERLAELTCAAEHAQTVSLGWSALTRALRQLLNELEKSAPQDSELDGKLSVALMWAIDERRTAHTAWERLTKQSNDLNGLIQNGVFNHE